MKTERRGRSPAELKALRRKYKLGEFAKRRIKKKPRKARKRTVQYTKSPQYSLRLGV